MKFSIERENLLKPLYQVSSWLGARQSLPILNNVLLQVKDGILSVTSTDLEIEMMARISLSHPYNSGTTTISSKKFFDICRSFPKESMIEVKLKEDQILICSGRSRFSLSTLSANDFPNTDASCYQEDIQFKLPQSTVKYLIESTQFSMANQDVRHYLNGILFEIQREKICTVATDGHRLAICSIPICLKLPNRSVIVPRKGILGLMRVINDSDIPLHLQISKNSIRVYLENFTFTSRLLDGCYPDYNCILPNNSKIVLEIDRISLKHAFSRVSILSNEKFRGVHFCLSKNQLKVISNNFEQEEAEEILDISYTGEEIEIGFNANYVLDVLNILNCKTVRIFLIDSVSSIKIEDADFPSPTYIIMPMRL